MCSTSPTSVERAAISTPRGPNRERNCRGNLQEFSEAYSRVPLRTRAISAGSGR